MSDGNSMHEACDSVPDAPPLRERCLTLILRQRRPGNSTAVYYYMNSSSAGTCTAPRPASRANRDDAQGRPKAPPLSSGSQQDHGGRAGTLTTGTMIPCSPRRGRTRKIPPGPGRATHCPLPAAPGGVSGRRGRAAPRLPAHQYHRRRGPGRGPMVTARAGPALTGISGILFGGPSGL
jgi:hypothetical protein